MKRILIFALACFWLAGCVTPLGSERLLVVSGELSKELTECKAIIRKIGVSPALVAMAVENTFKIDYPIEPRDGPYVVEIFCGNTTVLRSEFQSFSAITEVELGYISESQI